MDFQSIVKCLRALFSRQYQSEIEEFIASKHPKTTADVEQLIQQFNYKNSWPNA